MIKVLALCLLAIIVISWVIFSVSEQAELARAGDIKATFQVCQGIIVVFSIAGAGLILLTTITGGVDD